MHVLPWHAAFWRLKIFCWLSLAVIKLTAGALIQRTTLFNDTEPLLLSTAVKSNHYNFLPVEPYDPDWWKSTVIYQIYPRSFADSDGDGTGDLSGIISRLDYIASLGIRAIWISPFFESPQDDMGYDVSNFTRVDPLFGNNDDFAVLIDEAHRRGIRVIMDLVPNHTSYKHEWFEKSRNKVGVYANYYLWHAGDPARPVTVGPLNETRNGVPNNWASVFGNSVWTWDDVRREYYLHQFLKEMPDLNYRNPLVRYEMRKIVWFWLDRGVDGFRLDAWAHMYEEEPFLNNDEPSDPNGPPKDSGLYESLLHTKTRHQEGNFLLSQQWRKMIKQYAIDNRRDHIFMASEVYGDTIDESMSYDTYRGVKGADFCYNFNLVNITNASGFDVDRAVRVWLENLPPSDGWPNWGIGSHDRWRLVSRVGNNSNLIDGFNMLLLLLPGTPTTYYGEEIGMSNNFDITLEQTRDKNALTAAHLPAWKAWTRDYVRTPMQWTSQLPYAGFSPPNSSEPWLPVNEDALHGISVEAQQQTETNDNNNVSFGLPTTHLGVYKRLVQLRNQKPFTLGKTMTTGLVTQTLYSFFRKDAEPKPNSSNDDSTATYLVAMDLRQNITDGNTIKEYNFSQALLNANVTSPLNGRVVVLSTATKHISNLWQLAADQDKRRYSIDWSRVTLVPGESFVAEFA